MGKTDEKITVARGLTRLKTLKSQIDKKTNEFNGGNIITITQGVRVVPGYDTNDEYKSDVKSKYTSLRDIMSERKKLKSLIVVSNATTFVEIGTESMTVADAIERKAAINFDKALLLKMKSSYNTALKQFEEGERSIASDLERNLNNLGLNANTGRAGKLTAEIAEFTDHFNIINKLVLRDPIGLKTEIEKLETEIESFEEEVDFALSESNAKTKISI